MRALHVWQRKQEVHYPHKEGAVARENTWVEYTSTSAGLMQVKSAGGKEYEYIVVDDYTRAVDT